ncbi:S8 family serine peptidase [Roseateles sp. DC23W]|uniref:S8 family serine peptidase n=1 Tax=Pelomonas dachongensis TaxID=3299029 RepID=A0ABW7EVG8_9BURK
MPAPVTASAALRCLAPAWLALAALAAVPPALADTPAAPEGVIVKFKALGPLMRAARERGERGPQHAAMLAARHALGLRDGRMIDARSQVVRSDGTLTAAALAARLAKDADVEYAVPDGRRRALALPNDPLLPASTGAALAAGQWYLQPADATLVSAINAVGAWAITTGSASIVVADIDTGVLGAHPDLAAKLLPGYDFIAAASAAGDGGGRDADANDPGDWTSAGQCGSGEAATNSSWHGTQTASIIGAQTNNGAGMASVGYDVKLLPVRVLGKCGGLDSDIIAGMLWAGGVSRLPSANPNPAKVINLSLGGSGSCNAAYQDAVNQLVAAGVTVVAAAGNEEGLAVGLPANCSGVIAVAGVRHVGTKVGFSSIGPEVAIAAPGGNCVNASGACLYPILTATNSGTTTASTSGYTYSNSSNYSVGTSFAAPMVAGAAALMLSANPSLQPAQIKSMLQSAARRFPASATNASVPVCRAPTAVAQDECHCTTSTCGAGLLDVGAAVAAAAGAAAPTASIAANATSVAAGSTVTLDAAASTAPAGRSITGWQWTLAAGSGIAAFTGATNTATASLKTSGVGSITVQLTVTDSAGKQASSSTTLTAITPAAPTATLVASATTVAAGSPVSLDASGSQAANGFAITGYQWSIAATPVNLASFTTATNASTAALATLGNSSGTVAVTLTVTDSLGRTGTASTTVAVTGLGPTAAIGTAATSVAAGSTVSLDSTGSSAPTGRTLAGYQWSLTSGSAIAAFSGSTTGPTATVTTSATGTFTVQLTLTDSAGAQATKTQTITVTAPAAAAGTSNSAGGGGGGGSMSVLWLLALASAAALLRRRPPAPR